MKRIKAIIFDFDGTLASEKQYIYGCFKYIEPFIYEKFSIKDARQKLIALFEEEWNDTFGRLLRNENVNYSQKDIKQLVEMYRNVPPEVVLYDDVQDVLSKIKSLNIKTAVLTNGYFNVQNEKILKSGIAHLFDIIKIPDEQGREYWKPDIRAMQDILREFNVLPEETLFVGDSDNDYKTAQNIGSRFFYIKRADSVNLFNFEEKSDFCASSLDVLKGLIEERH